MLPELGDTLKQLPQVALDTLADQAPLTVEFTVTVV
jgi:hypothetical protein